MLGRRPRPFLRTTSKSQLALTCSEYGDEVEPAPRSELGEKYLFGAPHHVVIGFDVDVEGCNKPIPQSTAGHSPRSVLEPDALRDSTHQYHDHHHHHHQSRSPRSVLGSLLSGPGSHHLHQHGAGMGVTDAIRAQELAALSDTVCEKSQATAITGHNVIHVSHSKGACREMHESSTGRVSYFVNVFGGVEQIDHDEDDDDDDEDVDTILSCAQESIFYPPSPFSNCGSLDPPTHDFLNVCFFCRSWIMLGKDVFMYRGDRAFCSMECRYQQIAMDEAKERCLAGDRR